MSTYNPTGGQTYTLGASISSTQTTILLSSFLEPVSNTPYTMSMLNTDIVYATIAPKTTSTEFISFTGITQNSDGTATLTGVTRGLSRSYPFTSSSTFKLPHSGQTTFILSNSPQQINEYGVLRNDETITGYWKAPDPVGLTDVANKQWVLSVVNGGPISVDAIIVGGDAGETVANGDWLYYKVSDGLWYLTDADDTAKCIGVIFGKARGAGTVGNPITGGIFVQGIETEGTYVTGSTYYIGNTAGALSTSAGTNSVVVGYGDANGALVLSQVTPSRIDALAGGSTFGTPSSTNKFVTQDYLASSSGTATTHVYDTPSSSIGSATTQFDITNPSGTTFRYTYDGTGTDPNISSANTPVGSLIDINTNGGGSFSTANNGLFLVTGSGTNYFEVTNASGVVESNKVIGSGGNAWIARSGTTVWTKPAGLKYIVVEVLGGGAGGGTATSDGAVGGGGGAGGYAKRLIAAASLSATEALLVGAGGLGNPSGTGHRSSFGYLANCVGGSAGVAETGIGGVGGAATLGDINITGGHGTTGWGSASSPSVSLGGVGAGTIYGVGGAGSASGVGGTAGGNATGYGSGGGGAGSQGASLDGGTGSGGVIIVTEYYS